MASGTHAAEVAVRRPATSSRDSRPSDRAKLAQPRPRVRGCHGRQKKARGATTAEKTSDARNCAQAVTTVGRPTERSWLGRDRASLVPDLMNNIGSSD